MGNFVEEVIGEARCLMEMYQAGYLDAKGKKKFTDYMQTKCLESFEKRFGDIFAELNNEEVKNNDS